MTDRHISPPFLRAGAIKRLQVRLFVPSVVNPTKFGDVQRQMSPERFEQLLAIYKTNGRDQIRSLHQSFERGDLEGLRMAAHTLRASTSILGLEPLLEALTDLEMQANNGRWPLPGQVHAVSLAFDQSLVDLRLLLAESTV